MKDSIKIKVNDSEHATKIQEALFALDYAWNSEGKNVLNIPKNCYIYCSVNGVLAWGPEPTVSHYDEYAFENGNFRYLSTGRWGIV